MLIFFYISMITFMLNFGLPILTRTSLPFSLSYFFFRLKTAVDLSNSDLNFVKRCGVVMRQGDTHTFIAFYIMSFINWECCQSELITL